MDQKQFEATLHDAETRLRRLKTLYDQWLSGFERLEPTVARNELDEVLRRLRAEQVRNTALRFRLQQLVQRHTMLITYWRRIARQIEEGTYQRDVIRARKVRERHERQERTGAAEGAGEDGAYEVDVDVDLDAAMHEAAHAAEQATSTPPQESVVAKRPESTPPRDELVLQLPTAVGPTASSSGPPIPASTPTLIGRPPPVPAVAPRPSVAPRTISPFALPLPAPGGGTSMRAPPPPIPAAAMRPGTQAWMPPVPPAARAAPAAPAAVSAGQHGPATGLSNDDVQRIYAKYVAARKDNAERVDNVKLETIEKSLRGMLPQLEKKHTGKKIDFEVVVKDGKVALKPVAK